VLNTYVMEIPFVSIQKGDDLIMAKAESNGITLSSSVSVSIPEGV